MAAFAICRASRQLAPLAGRCLGHAARGAAPTPVACRAFASAAGGKVAKALEAEIKHEKEAYEQAKEIKAFLKASPFKVVETDGDVNMALERDTGDHTVRIEWQLSSPFDPEGVEGEDGEQGRESTDLSVTVEKKSGGAGLTFYCSTSPGEDHRYVIGNVRAFGTAEEKDSVTSYNGPEFEDLDDKLQESFDEYLAELGMSSEVCDFVDTMALDKEQREYVSWLQRAQKFLAE